MSLLESTQRTPFSLRIKSKPITKAGGPQVTWPCQRPSLHLMYTLSLFLILL